MSDTGPTPFPLIDVVYLIILAKVILAICFVARARQRRRMSQYGGPPQAWQQPGTPPGPPQAWQQPGTPPGPYWSPQGGQPPYPPQPPAQGYDGPPPPGHAGQPPQGPGGSEGWAPPDEPR
ncbi:hypothetical protein GCM10023196_107160 [Actinoallomurus vinaceus]|uniref:Uncharacterized protein n=1 Tax=Actinoallomurus vinaceus TaxID=1080074 RepID=A0ABP8UVP3_9ACTN